MKYQARYHGYPGIRLGFCQPFAVITDKVVRILRLLPPSWVYWNDSAAEGHRMIELSDCEVLRITYQSTDYLLAKPAKVIDEDSFYRIDGSHIFDKMNIRSVVIVDDRITLQLRDEVVVLKVVKRHNGN